MSSFIIEACVDSLDSAIAAQEGGADRIELCSALSEGGLTPSAGVLNSVVRRFSTPSPPTSENNKCRVHVLIRPRCGDFLYSNIEMESIRYDVLNAATTGADGIVVGFLSRHGRIDTDKTSHFQELCTSLGLDMTFHRAFDVVKDQTTALESLVACGVRRVLSSGGETIAVAGAEKLAELQEQAAGRLIVMPGGGINAENVASIVQLTAAREIHGTFRRSVQSSTGRYYSKKVNFNCTVVQGGGEVSESDDAWRRTVTDADELQNARRRLEELAASMG